MSYAVIVVTGGRDYADKDHIWQQLDGHAPEMLYVGCCPTGADAHALAWAKTRGVDYCVFYANWDVYGKSAGPRRNKAMMKSASRCLKNDEKMMVLAFKGGAGTKNAITNAQQFNLNIKECWGE